MDALPLHSGTRGRIDALGKEFLANFYKVECRRHPENLEVLADLGHLLTELGRYEEGLEVDRELVRRVPDDPTVHYNLACSLALLGRVDEALDSLEASVQRGYSDVEAMLADEDLTALRGELRYEALVRRLREEPRPTAE